MKEMINKSEIIKEMINKVRL